MDAKSFGSLYCRPAQDVGTDTGRGCCTLHVTDKAVSRWERGVGLPDINMLEPLAQVLHLTLDELIHTGTSGTGSGADSVKTFVDLFSPAEPVCRSTSPCRMSAVIHPVLSGRAFAMSGQPCNFVGCRRTDRPCFLRRKVLYLSYCGIAAMSGIIFLALL